MVLFIKSKIIKKVSKQKPFFGAPGGIRTPDLPVRSRTLYPTKLLVHINNIYYTLILKNFQVEIEILKIFQKILQIFLKCAIIYKRLEISRCSAVGSARGLGPLGRRFDPCHLDHIQKNSQEFFFFCIYEQMQIITALHSIHLNFFSLSKTSIKSINF